MKAVAGVVFCIGLAAFGVFAWAMRSVMSPERALDPGDVVILGVFAAFGAFCVGLGWHLWRSTPPEPATQQDAEPLPRKRVALSNACAAVGVLLLMLSALLPAHWYPVVLLFLGLAFLAVSHALKPCVERIEQLRKARASVRQL